ncbi:AGE family epimerase/isomerase [Georgenia subflava]|uniref:N-acylglucosamine 2-epimerase n=1 Tax=Georgenia subflava TaxID=1622177 RepID=A0A6N7EEB4_9MICO|nr:AGE family epimerase/isomerase [Georgenia subflava]MPV36449.1 N-acylglucosamine 2-epimerase [Georgenia subflava]
MGLRQAPAQAREQLERTILPFWLSRGVDHHHGGFHTCFDNRGLVRTSTDKFTWSQGRFVWLLAHAAELAREELLDLDALDLLALAGRGAEFLATNAVGADGTCAFVLARDGSPSTVADRPARSVYADCFVVMGLAELARVSGDAGWLSTSRPVLERARQDIRSGTAPTPPYDVPTGYTAFGPKMILLNTLVVHVAAERAAAGTGRQPAAGDGSDLLAEALEEVMAHRLDDGTFAEMIGPEADSLVARHRVPGHAIEGLWVALEAMDLLGIHHHVDAVLESVPALCALGWDTEHGGLLRYTDAAGPGRPRGRSDGTPYEQLLQRTWSTKLWWVHSEAAATTAIAARRFDHAPSAGWFDRIWDYTLGTFPAGAEGNEWIQIRDRAGRPLDEVVALPVKDPFHLVRNLMQIVELGRAPAS